MRPRCVEITGSAGTTISLRATGLRTCPITEANFSGVTADAVIAGLARGAWVTALVVRNACPVTTALIAVVAGKATGATTTGGSGVDWCSTGVTTGAAMCRVHTCVDTGRTTQLLRAVGRWTALIAQPFALGGITCTLASLPRVRAKHLRAEFGTIAVAAPFGECRPRDERSEQTATEQLECLTT